MTSNMSELAVVRHAIGKLIEPWLPLAAGRSPHVRNIVSGRLSWFTRLNAVAGVIAGRAIGLQLEMNDIS